MPLRIRLKLILFCAIAISMVTPNKRIENTGNSKSAIQVLELRIIDVLALKSR